MIIETDSDVLGIIVEKLISDQEIIHKKLAAPLYKVKHISGITTLANGEACLILNISDIISTVLSTKIGSKVIQKNASIKTAQNSDYKILIVDDSYTTRTLQKNILSAKGYDVSLASNPEDALLQAKKTNYDLVLSDIEMPKMNGFEFITELRKIKAYQDTPVIVMSSQPKEKFLNEIANAKVSEYIRKSEYEQGKMLSAIDRLLHKKLF